MVAPSSPYPTKATSDTALIAVSFWTYLYALALRGMMVIMACTNNIDLARVDRGSEEGMTPQSLIKVGLIGVAGLLGMWGWWRSSATRALLLSFPGILMILLGLQYFFSATFSIEPKISFAAAIAFVCIVLFVSSAVIHVGGKKLMLDIVMGLLLFVAGSVLLYLVSPEYTFFREVLGPNNIKIRFGGLGHPNVLGRICVYSALILLAAGLHKSIRMIWFWGSLPILAIVLFATLSRTPVIAGVASAAIVAIPLLKRPFYIYVAGIGLLLGLVILLFAETSVGTDRLFDQFIAGSTKTGSVEEVTTMTGRTRIWAFAWEKALESPLVGWGAGTTPILMAGVSGHAHNILLQPTVSLGFPGGILFLMLLFWNVYASIRFSLPMLRMTTTFILILGIAETPLFNPLPESVTLMWLVCCFWPLALDADNPRNTFFRSRRMAQTSGQS